MKSVDLVKLKYENILVNLVQVSIWVLDLSQKTELKAAIFVLVRVELALLFVDECVKTI